jgi:cephalosporin-C deacetylase-like acetyl esterase
MEDLGPAWYTLPDPLNKKEIAVKRTDSMIKSS